MEEKQRPAAGHNVVAPVLSAAQSGDIEEMKRLLDDKHVDVNLRGEFGNTPLLWAIYFNELRIISLLLTCPRVNLEVMNDRGQNCIHIAATNNAIDSLKLLLNHKVAVGFVNSQNIWGETPLHLSAAAGHSSIVSVLLAAGARTDLTDKWGRTSPLVAAEHGEQKVLKTFTEHGIDCPPVERKTYDAHGRHHNDGSLASLLITNTKPSEHKQSFATNTPMPVEAPLLPPPACSSPVFTAVRSGQNIVNQLKGVTLRSTTQGQAERIEGRASARQSRPLVNLQHDDGRKPLSKLIEYPGDLELLPTLLADRSINPGGADMFGLTALHKFASWDTVELLNMLIPTLNDGDLNRLGGDSQSTPLHLALEMGALRAVNRLMREPGINVDVKNGEGKTALELAKTLDIEIKPNIS